MQKYVKNRGDGLSEDRRQRTEQVAGSPYEAPRNTGGINMFFIISLLSLPCALLLDYFWGEPPKYHPLVGFGNLANWLEAQLNRPETTPLQQGILGIAAWIIAVIPLTLLFYWFQLIFSSSWLASLLLATLCGWLAIGWNSLRQHGLAVEQAIRQGDLEQARLKTSYLVSRETSRLDESALSTASIESILENGSDAVIAPLFWLLIVGAPGVILYRLSNTLDAMWGYHNQRFEYFGKFTARVDDLLNYIPARITALLYCLGGKTKQAWKAWQTQGINWYSPNAGIVMASGAGSLGLKLGGTAIYHGVQKSRPKLGYEKEAEAEDIKRAIRLLDKSIYTIALLVTLLFVVLLFIFFIEADV